MDQNKKAKWKASTWLYVCACMYLVITRYQKNKLADTEIFLEEEAFLEWVKITLGEWILRVTSSNGEYSQNFVSNTDVTYNLTSPLQWQSSSYMTVHSQKTNLQVLLEKKWKYIVYYCSNVQFVNEMTCTCILPEECLSHTSRV